MKVPNVKSTMINSLLSRVAPHYCCSCGEIGQHLCESCKYDITDERFDGCLLCGQLKPPSGACLHCRSEIELSWCGGERSGALEQLINRFKFEYAQDAHIPLGQVLLAVLPELPAKTVVVPVPTVRAHIRQRGYDHALLLARYVADQRGLALERAVVRRSAYVQRGSDRKTRLSQAKEAFKVEKKLQKDAPYLLVDDVVTTGATLREATKVLRGAGISTVWAAAVARQPLD